MQEHIKHNSDIAAHEILRFPSTMMRLHQRRHNQNWLVGSVLCLRVFVVLLVCLFLCLSSLSFLCHSMLPVSMDCEFFIFGFHSNSF
jgi:hypothetical protein